ncbi:hypothetical protein EDD16DRAFT_951648 [Pisolithus croceorrhizus]|nr:hypothetical protein EV401DRAFT_175752 [Pisolithus croceorrhizus]KAI6119044.1 hypothetical protein EDD16DRAFT_951648 [Pisolithus croceorrhizus]KAI6163376.1 hypothetical protein EDD17DRAFT_494529 [Pisolithus thermaeus]
MYFLRVGGVDITSRTTCSVLVGGYYCTTQQPSEPRVVATFFFTLVPLANIGETEDGASEPFTPSPSTKVLGIAPVPFTCAFHFLVHVVFHRDHVSTTSTSVFTTPGTRLVSLVDYHSSLHSPPHFACSPVFCGSGANTPEFHRRVSLVFTGALRESRLASQHWSRMYTSSHLEGGGRLVSEAAHLHTNFLFFTFIHRHHSYPFYIGSHSTPNPEPEQYRLKNVMVMLAWHEPFSKETMYSLVSVKNGCRKNVLFLIANCRLHIGQQEPQHGAFLHVHL